MSDGCSICHEKKKSSWRSNNNDAHSTDEQLNNQLETASAASQSIATSIGPHHHHELAIIFDIDGTLIAEQAEPCDRSSSPSYIIRPGARELLRWLFARNHKLALWTMGNQIHVERVLDELGFTEEDFVSIWAAGGKEAYIRKQQQPPIECQDGDTTSSRYCCCCLWWKTMVQGGSKSSRECQWCGVYRKVCQRCQCHLGRQQHDNHRLCPCRSVKDLRKVWYSSDEVIQSIFFQHNTLIVENTPQQCVFNLDNMILIPSYYYNTVGEETTNEEELCLLTSLQEWIERKLETADDVRKVQKCNCCVVNNNEGDEEIRHHACLAQMWWTARFATTPQPDVAMQQYDGHLLR